MVGEIKLVLKSNFESLPSFEPEARGPWAQGMRKEPDFLSQFRYAKLNETISNTKLYAFDDVFTRVTHYTQWNPPVYYNLFQVV